VFTVNFTQIPQVLASAGQPTAPTPLPPTSPMFVTAHVEKGAELSLEPDERLMSWDLDGLDATFSDVVSVFPVSVEFRTWKLVGTQAACGIDVDWHSFGEIDFDWQILGEMRIDSKTTRL